MNAQPPHWAQSLLGLLVSDRNRDGILGDLVEEYRESRLPARGAAAADRWYVRQVFGFYWRASAPWGVMLGMVFATRDVMDLAMPTSDYRVRAAVCTYIGRSIFGLAAIRAAWRSGRALSGPAVCLGVTAITTVIAFAAPAVLTVLLRSELQRNPLAADALREAYDVPVPVIFVMGVVIGSIGGGIGRGLNRLMSASRPSFRT
jgi:hypothetical protein